jgi:UDPglucose--hexose-1-phosphate uridylyltransferase
MSELRWNPFLRQWVVVASHRQDRPQMPKNWCPFCPGSGRVPDHYDVLLYPNDFPAFDMESGPFDPTPGLFKTTGSPGACDVVLYSPEHTKTPASLSVEQWRKVVDLWCRRTAELTQIPEVQSIMVFENQGEAIGVTMPHPHGQIYAFPFHPPLVEIEYNSAAAHHSESGECLYCTVLAEELRTKERAVAENERFAAFVPFAARFPTEVQIYSKRHFGSLMELTGDEAQDLASIISIVRRKYDNLYGFQLPLMMVLRQAPAKGESPWFHFHIEFLPIQRSATKLKYLAAVESAGGTFLNDTKAEAQAKQLRDTDPVG